MRTSAAGELVNDAFHDQLGLPSFHSRKQPSRAAYRDDSNTLEWKSISHAR